MKLKVMEWNIHGAASMGWNNNYTIPKFVVDRILNEEAEIIILAEFVISKGWDYLQSKFEESNYVWFMTHTSSQNGILIAINKNIEGLNLEEIKKYESDKIFSTMDIDAAEKPDFLQVDIEINNESLIVIGTRIRVKTNEEATDSQKIKFKQNQFKALDKHLSNLKNEHIVCTGDFNAYWRNNKGSIWGTNSNTTLPSTSKTYDIQTPNWDSKRNRFSYVLPNKVKCTFDHIISKGLDVTNEDYSWDFVSQNNGYGNLKAADYKTHLKGLPDHAILVADIEL